MPVHLTDIKTRRESVAARDGRCGVVLAETVLGTSSGGNIPERSGAPRFPLVRTPPTVRPIMYELYLVLNTAFFVAIVYYAVIRGSMSIYSGLFIYFVFHFVAFVQRPIVVDLWDIRSEFIFMNFMPTQDQLVETLLAADLGLLSFVIGYMLALGGTVQRPSFVVPEIGPIAKSAFVTAFLLLSPLMLYSFFLAFTMRQAYGIEALEDFGRLNLQVDPATGQHLFADTSAYLVFARNMAFPFATAFILAKRGAWWSYLPMLIACAVSLQVGERWPVVIGILVAMLCALYLNRRESFSLPQYAAIAATLVVFIMIGQNRDALIRLLTTGEFNFDFDFLSSSLGAHPDFANFEFLSYVVSKVPAVSKTYTYFTQYLGLFTQPIPRVLWPDKPVGSPVTLVNLEAYGRFASRSTSLVGDGWMSLGYFGVAATMALVGAFYAKMYRLLCRPDNSFYFLCAYFWFIALLVQWARDGGIRIFDFLFFCTGPTLFARMLDRFVLRPRRHERGRVSRV